MRAPHKNQPSGKANLNNRSSGNVRFNNRPAPIVNYRSWSIVKTHDFILLIGRTSALPGWFLLRRDRAAVGRTESGPSPNLSQNVSYPPRES